jgi:exodeoxyribonuclease VII small subunit
MPQKTNMSPPTPPPQNSPAPAPADDKPGFDQVLDRLRQIVARLEQGNLPLEQALQAFEEGVQLSRAGSAILDAAELRVEALVRGEDGSESTKPLPPAAPSS